MSLRGHVRIPRPVLHLVKSKSCLTDVHLSTRRLYLTTALRRNKIPFSYLLRNSLSTKGAFAGENPHSVPAETDHLPGRSSSVSPQSNPSVSDHILCNKCGKCCKACTSTSSAFGKFTGHQTVERKQSYISNVDKKVKDKNSLRFPKISKPDGRCQISTDTSHLLLQGQKKRPAWSNNMIANLESAPNIWNKLKTQRAMLHSTSKSMFRGETAKKSMQQDTYNSPPILEQVSQLFNHPDWTMHIRNRILASAGEDSAIFVDDVLLPSIQEHITDHRLVTESLIILLLSRLSGTATSDVKQPSTSSTLTLEDGYLTLAVIFMMKRITLRHHYLIEGPYNAGSPTALSNYEVKLQVLTGDLIEVVCFLAITELRVPEILGLVYAASSESVNAAFKIANTMFNKEGQSQETSKGTDHPTDPTKPSNLFPWEDQSPVALSCFCQSTILLSGDKPELRQAARLFGHHLAVAKSIPQESTLDDQGSLTERSNHLNIALESLKAFPASKERELMSQLAYSYAGFSI